MTEQLEKLTPEDGKSLDLEAQNIEQLKQLFPDVFREGKVDFEALKAVLGDHVEDKEERYNFTWHGKNKARQIAQIPSLGTLRPKKNESVNWETTKNLFIEGDNLEVLKLLQKTYHKKVKMIFIDPPYNTGKEFIYPDNFQDNLDTYLKFSGQVDDKGFKISANSETSGRYHTNWLNMIYPRLKLARNLLKDDGLIFISIDDHELVNLRNVCNEVFGEDNFVANILWQKKTAPDARMQISDAHDHVLLYARNSENLDLNYLPLEEKRRDSFKNPDNDPRGAWVSVDLTGQTGNAPKTQFYTIETPSGEQMPPPEGRCWAMAERTFKALVEDNRVWFGKDGTNRPRLKKFLSESKGNRPWTWWDNKSVGHSQEGSQELKALFDNQPVFDNPKPIRLIQRMLQLSTSKGEDNLILDFFAGSASTAHAVIAQSCLDEVDRKFIMVQLPEPLDPSANEFKVGGTAFKLGYETIADVSKDRIRKVGAQIDTSKKNVDVGFRVFKLDSSNVKQWEPDFDNLSDILDNTIDSIKPERTSEDVLYEILLKYGLDLTYPITEHGLADKTVYDVAFGSLIVCLDDGITREVVEAIGKLKQELDSETTRVVFKDAGFADDSVKVNAIQMLKQYGVDDVKSI